MTELEGRGGPKRGDAVLFTCRTKKAARWVAARVELEPWQWLGKDIFAVEHRYAGALVMGMTREGLVVE